MKKVLLVLVLSLMLVSCGKKEIYNGIESNIKVDKEKLTKGGDDTLSQLRGSEYIKNLYSDKVWILKDDKNLVYDNSKNKLQMLELGYGVHDADGEDLLLYSSNGSYLNELVIKGKNKTEKVIAEKHISDAKLLNGKVYGMALRSDSPIKFFECEILKNDNGKMVATGKIGKLVKNSKSIMYASYKNNKLTVKDMEDKEIFSHDLTEKELPVDIIMNGDDVIYSIFNYETEETDLYKNDKKILESKIKGYEQKLKYFQLTDKYLSWFDDKIVYDVKDDKFVVFDEVKDDMMLVPVGDNIYGLNVKNATGIFDDNTMLYK